MVTLGSVSNWSLDLVGPRWRRWREGPTSGSGRRRPQLWIRLAPRSRPHHRFIFSCKKKEQRLIWQERLQVITGLSKVNRPVGKYWCPKYFFQQATDIILIWRESTNLVIAMFELFRFHCIGFFCNNPCYINAASSVTADKSSEGTNRLQKNNVR